MKKIISFVLLMVLLISITGCSSKGSGLTIDALQQALQESDSDLSFQKTKSGTGYEFHYTDNSSVLNIEYTGNADSKENVTSIKIVNSEVPVSALKSTTELTKILSKNASQLTRNDLRAMYCYLAALNLCQAFDGKDSTLSVTDFVNLFPGYTIMKGNWIIRADIEGSDTVIISATYYN